MTCVQSKVQPYSEDCVCVCQIFMHSIFTIQKVHEFPVELWTPMSVEHFESTFLAYRKWCKVLYS